MKAFDKIVKARMVQIDIINTSGNQHDIQAARGHIAGMQEALELAGWSESELGQIIMACDQVQFDRGVNVPMCGGEFL